MRSRLLAPALTIVAGLGLALPGSAAVARQAPLPTHVNDCWSTDRVAPVVDSLSVSPSVVDTTTSAIVEYTVRAHDLGGPGPSTGVGKVEVSLHNKVGGGGVADTYLTRGSDGVWRGGASVPTGRTGTYDAEVRVWDRSGDGTVTLQTSEVQPHFFGDVLQATDTAPPPPHDTTPPSLTAFHVSAGQVDTRKKGQILTLTATATDDVSGVAELRVDFQPNNGSSAHHTLLDRVGTTDDFQGEARFRTATGDHYEGLAVVVKDLAGNTVGYGRGGLRRLGVTPRIRVLSGPKDQRGPRLVRALQAAPSVDVHQHGRWYPVRLLMTDPQGVASVSAHLRGETPEVTLHRVSGTRWRGVWAGRMRVHRCSFGPVTVPLHVNATDGRGVTHGTAVRAVRILSPDRTPPRVHGLWSVSPTVFRFSEPVHGISATTVDAYDKNLDPISGTWKCRDGRGGHSHRVSCRTGSVLRATFFPDVAGTQLGLVDWEPGLHIDVLDAHGNPIYFYTTFNPQVID
ncbi:MAG TPA: hypothetical protein VH085_01725 [Nocardioides sp.]|jgi:hypothetical protein|nr:hypothetical protein [Nocardioides sp.]